MLRLLMRLLVRLYLRLLLRLGARVSALLYASVGVHLTLGHSCSKLQRVAEPGEHLEVLTTGHLDIKGWRVVRLGLVESEQV